MMIGEVSREYARVWEGRVGFVGSGRSGYILHFDEI
jgi:hypothetical protein